MGGAQAEKVVIETRIKVYNSLTHLTDMLSAGLAFLAAALYSTPRPFTTRSDGLTYVNLHAFSGLALSLAAVLASHLVFSAFRYTLKQPYGVFNLLRMAPRLAGVALLDCLAVLLIYRLLTGSYVPREFFAVMAVLVVGVSMVMRFAAQGMLGWFYNSKSNRMNILIVGTNQRACDFYRYISSNGFLGYNVVGFIDDFNYLGDQSMHILGPLREFSRIARENILDSVVVFLPVRSYYDQVMAIIEGARTQGVPVQHMYTFFDHRRIKASPSTIGSHSGMHIGYGPTSIWLIWAKRLFDIVFASVALVFITPVVLAAALAVKLDSPGPAFFIQRRVGYHKRKIGVFKLRTMVVGAEGLMDRLNGLNEMDGPVFKIRHDPRITRVGRLLRRYNIDELPQFLNVLWGDMSVVGPRPMAERDFKGFSEDWLNKRFSMRPGITCTWQVQPARNAIPFSEWMRMDMEYIDNWSFWLDMRIIFRTVLVTLRGTGS